MNVASICSRDIVSVNREESLQKAARLMREHHVGTVVVTQMASDGAHVAGLVTDRDLVIEVLARGGDTGNVAIGALLGAQTLLSVAGSADLGEAIALMHSGGVRRLLVRDDDGHLVGVLSFDDLFRVCAAQFAGLAGALATGREREATSVWPLPPTSPGEPAPPVAPPLPPQPRLRVPAMGTAGWTVGTGLRR
ncbi:MAG: CBS domain-containing protein [Burkholderiales bacterium]|nr:CBS domain-containing protein [Burkholderiales bacterium]